MGELLDKVNSETQHHEILDKLISNEKYSNHIDGKITQVVSNTKKTLDLIEDNKQEQN